MDTTRSKRACIFALAWLFLFAIQTTLLHATSRSLDSYTSLWYLSLLFERFMNITLNHKPYICPSEQMTLEALLAHEQITREHIAVAINQHIVPRAEWGTRLLSHNDQVLIIGAIKGG